MAIKYSSWLTSPRFGGALLDLRKFLIEFMSGIFKETEEKWLRHTGSTADQKTGFRALRKPKHVQSSYK